MEKKMDNSSTSVKTRTGSEAVRLLGIELLLDTSKNRLDRSYIF